jgi:large subunit ribosomal protein L9
MALIDVILLQRIEALGQMGDVVKVKPGYARNFLLPQKKAMRATKDNIAVFERQRAQLEAQNLKHRQEAEGVAKRMDALSVIVIRQAGETGQLYGSVNNRDIAEAVTKSGFTVDRRQVQLDQPIKALGLTKVRVALHPEVVVPITVNVAQSEDEAAAQAAGDKPRPDDAGEAPAAEPPGEAAAAPAAEAKPRKTKKEAPPKVADDDSPASEQKPKKAKKAAKAKEQP